jgi:hypothetical protein
MSGSIWGDRAITMYFHDLMLQYGPLARWCNEDMGPWTEIDSDKLPAGAGDEWRKDFFFLLRLYERLKEHSFPRRDIRTWTAPSRWSSNRVITRWCGYPDRRLPTRDLSVSSTPPSNGHGYPPGTLWPQCDKLLLL